MLDTTTTPPNNEIAEAAMLACCMWEAHPELAKRYAGELTEEDFYRTRHKVVFRAICDLVADHSAVDLITVHARLKTTDALDAAGGLAGLMGLWEVTPICVHHEFYGELLRALRARRDLMAIGYDLTRSASLESDDTGTLISATESRMQDVAAQRSASTPVLTMAEAVVLTRVRIAEDTREDSAGGISTGFPELDALIGSLEPGKLGILAARPGMGKSSLAMQMLKVAASSDHPSLFFSVEMGIEETTRRWIAQGMDLEAIKLRTPGAKLSKRHLDDASMSLSILPISIDGTPQIKIAELRTKAIAWARRMIKRRPGLIVVDHLQLIDVPGYGPDDRHLALGHITRALKALSRETGCHVLSLCQLSRKLEGRTDKRPILSDLRESGSIEEDADLVLFVYRDGYYTKQPSNAEVIIGKQRSGSLGMAELEWDGPSMRFGSPSERANAHLARRPAPNYQDREPSIFEEEERA